MKIKICGDGTNGFSGEIIIFNKSGACLLIHTISKEFGVVPLDLKEDYDLRSDD